MKGKSKKASTTAKSAQSKAARKERALQMMNNIINNEQEAKRFFLVDMYPKMASLARGYNRMFDLSINPDELACVTYLACWENDWARLRTFKGDTTPHAWIAQIASKVTYQHLVDEKYIPAVNSTKANNYRLTVRGIENPHLRQDIVDLVYVPKLHKILSLYYVDKVADEEIYKIFGGKETAQKTLKTAQKALIEQLLFTENPYADMALSSKKPINPEVEFQPWHDCIDESDVSVNKQFFRDTLSRIFNSNDWDSNTMTLIDKVVDSLPWSEEDKYIWRERFISKTPSLELAEMFHVRDSYINLRFSHLNKAFLIKVKKWWDDLKL